MIIHRSAHFVYDGVTDQIFIKFRRRKVVGGFEILTGKDIELSNVRIYFTGTGEIAMIIIDFKPNTALASLLRKHITKTPRSD